MATDPTTNASLKSWVESANDDGGEFPIQNLPYCVAWGDDASESHLAVRIGNHLFSLTSAFEYGLFDNLDFGEHNEDFQAACDLGSVELLGGMTPTERLTLRSHLSTLLRHGSKDRKTIEKSCFIPVSEASFDLPTTVQNYTDFYASIHHATTVGSMFRPDQPLLPNYKWVPIGYHGRASTVDIDRGPIRRPHGQTKADDAAAPTFGPCAMLDYELEVGCYVAGENDRGTPISIAQARNHILGYCLVNDWSARDIQKWEYQPLGPFLAKNFATTVSPYVVTPEAIAPFRCAPTARPDGDPQPLAYLLDADDRASGSFDLELEVHLQSAEMARRSISPMLLSRSRAFKDLYWTFAQMITHHSSNGCMLRSGDLIASGTVSGPDAATRGCLLELTWDGPGKPRRPIELPTGEKRVFLADGDTVIFKGRCTREGTVTIGFGECRGTIALA
jgi:fumarylacetoacetase